MISILKKEFKTYFYSPIAYVFIGFFLLLSGYFFATTNLFYGAADMKMVFGNMNIIFLFLTPILTMRLLSEEKRSKTDQLLITSPVNITGIVLGKYFAAVAVLLIALLITGIYPLILSIFGSPATAETLGGYLGFFFLGTSFIAIGLFISSLTESQITSAIVSFGVLIFLWVIDWIVPAVQNQFFANILEWLSILKRFQDFLIGVLNLTPILYYLTFSAIFIFLTIQVLEKRRWS